MLRRVDTGIIYSLIAENLKFDWSIEITWKCQTAGKSDFFEQAQVFVQLLSFLNLLSTNPTKWSNTLKQFIGNLPTNCLSVFDHFMNLALKGLTVEAGGLFRKAD